MNVLDKITDFYVASHDFNGITLIELCHLTGLDELHIREVIAGLVGQGHVTLTFASHSGNPHIKRLPDLPIEEQLSRLGDEAL